MTRPSQLYPRRKGQQPIRRGDGTKLNQLRWRTLNEVIWHQPQVCTTNGSWDIEALPVWQRALPVWWRKRQLRLRTLNQVIWHQPRVCTTNGSWDTEALPVWWRALPVWRRKFDLCVKPIDSSEQLVNSLKNHNFWQEWARDLLFFSKCSE